jgi:NADPH-dependent curcumin reductase CurA
MCGVINMYNHHLPGKVTPSLGDLSWSAKHIKGLLCPYLKKRAALPLPIKGMNVMI